MRSRMDLASARMNVLFARMDVDSVFVTNTACESRKKSCWDLFVVVGSVEDVALRDEIQVLVAGDKFGRLSGWFSYPEREPKSWRKPEVYGYGRSISVERSNILEVPAAGLGR